MDRALLFLLLTFRLIWISILLILFSLLHNLLYRRFIIEKITQLISLKLEKPFILLIVGNCNLPDVSVKPILLNIEDPKFLPCLDHPDVIGFLGRLASPVDRMDLDILVFGLSWVDHDHYVNVIGRCYLPEAGHYLVLEIKFCVALGLIREEELERVQDHY